MGAFFIYLNTTWIIRVSPASNRRAAALRRINENVSFLKHEFKRHRNDRLQVKSTPSGVIISGDPDNRRLAFLSKQNPGLSDRREKTVGRGR